MAAKVVIFADMCKFFSAFLTESGQYVRKGMEGGEIQWGESRFALWSSFIRVLDNWYRWAEDM